MTCMYMPKHRWILKYYAMWKKLITKDHILDIRILLYENNISLKLFENYILKRVGFLESEYLNSLLCIYQQYDIRSVTHRLQSQYSIDKLQVIIFSSCFEERTIEVMHMKAFYVNCSINMATSTFCPFEL